MENNTLPPNTRKPNRFRPKISLPKIRLGSGSSKQSPNNQSPPQYTRLDHSVYRPPASTKRSKNRGGLSSVLSTIGILIMAPLIAVVLTTYVFQSYEVDGPSMQQTLQDNDRLIVWKFPKSFSKLSGGGYIPGRGDIIVFNKSDSATFGTQEKRQLIKRVVALPGERIVIRDGSMTVYNRDNPFGFDPDIEGGYSGEFERIVQGSIDITIPKGEVFVVGDNRSNSLDSRTFGAVKQSDIIGSLVLRIFPFNQVKAF